MDKYKADRHVRDTLKPLEIEQFGDWRDDVRKWWNDWVNEGWFHKRKQLFLWGASDSGKTTFIREFLLQGIDDDSIFIPTKVPCSAASRFSWSQYEPYKHVVMMLDEFDCNTVDTNAFKLVCEGEAMCSDVKHHNSKKLYLRIPQIYISQVFKLSKISKREIKVINK